MAEAHGTSGTGGRGAAAVVVSSAEATAESGNTGGGGYVGLAGNDSARGGKRKLRWSKNE
jgi:hypothetical protein